MMSFLRLRVRSLGESNPRLERAGGARESLSSCPHIRAASDQL